MSNDKELKSYVLGYSKDYAGKNFFQFSGGGEPAYGYSDPIIEHNIVDLDGEKTRMPTAVPSPFARFDLVQTAFKNVAKGLREGAKAAGKFDQRIVSHTLDLANLVFNSLATGNYDGKLDILVWRRKGEASQLTELKNGQEPHKAFAKSLELYLNQDQEHYNFDKMDRIFLFRYTQGQSYIVGSTSPVTLFCPSATDYSKLAIKRMPDQSPYFGETFLPFWERTAEFQEWFYHLISVCKAKYPENEGLGGIYDYMDSSLKQTGPYSGKVLAAKGSIEKSSDVSGDFEKKYDVLNTAMGSGSPMDILGIELHVGKSCYMITGMEDSDFCIAPTKDECSVKPLPLVLQDGFGKTGWSYMGGTYIPPIKVESHVGESWQTPREMPGYPTHKGRYLTVSDFLEPYLVRTVYPISKQFYDAGCSSDKNPNGYLLPLRKDFFKFFNIQDLREGGKGDSGKPVKGKPRLSIIPDDKGNVKVILSIPVKKEGQHIEFVRTYKQENTEPDPSNPEGGRILDRMFGITIFPFIKTPTNIAKANYRIQLVDCDSQLPEHSLGFYSQAAPERSNNLARTPIQRLDKSRDLATSKYYKIENHFDFIQFEEESLGVRALVVPIWPPFAEGTRQFTFAVDFGTTNTYLAYTIDKDKTPTPFDISDKMPDIQIATLFDVKFKEIIDRKGCPEIVELVESEFVPRKIGRKNEKDGTEIDNIFAFPQRTALSFNKQNTKWKAKSSVDALMGVNIPLGYEKIRINSADDVSTNLKWNSCGDESNNAKMRAYLEQLVMLMQAKVLSNGGSLSDTRLIWFYPNAMGPGRLGELREAWEDFFGKYFFNGNKPGNSLIEVMESLAPFYAQSKGKTDVKDGAVVSIDIGGGTTDVAVFIDANLKGTTSFRFAGDALFGDGYEDQNSENNGFVIAFEEAYQDLLKPYRKPRGILGDLLKSKKASDINAFLFSIEKTIEYWAKEQDPKADVKVKDYSYNSKLSAKHDLKFLILYFYVALIYHISKVLKKIETDSGKEIEFRYLMFSGTGSKILKILAGEKILTGIARKVFEDNRLKSESLEVTLVKDPKEATCNGGLIADPDTIKKDMPDIDDPKKNKVTDNRYIYTCIKDENGNEIIAKGKHEINNLNYSSYENGSKHIKEELDAFHKYFFELNKHFDFEDYFTIPSYITEYVENNYESLLNKYVLASIRENMKAEKIKNPNKGGVSETPFFMPLKVIILELSKLIAEKKIKG